MEQRIRKAAVLGAGLMGSQIAAHLANVGIPSILLDLAPTTLTPQEEQRGLTLTHPAVRNRLAQQGLQAVARAKPAPFYAPEMARLVTIGNLEDDLPRLREADWVVEAVTERLDIKQQLYQRVAPHLHDDAVLSSNTSGLSITALSESLTPVLQTRFLGTHFFNPPRYAQLLELIPGPQTTPEVMQMMTNFGRHRLGKGVLRAKDTPNFIANRLGVYDLLCCLHIVQAGGYRVSEVDTVTGALSGRAMSAFRTADLVGLDTLLHVVQHSLDALPDDAIQSITPHPNFMPAMVARGWLGNKTGQGFYKRVQTEAGRAFYEIDPETLEYRPQERLTAPSLQQLRQIEDVSKRLSALVFAEDRAGQLAWRLFSDSLCYAASVATDIADDIVAVDNAMKWGFRWTLGPFETWDALGVERVAKRLESEGHPVPPLVEQVLQTEHPSFYLHQKGQQRQQFDLAQNKHIALPPIPRTLSLSSLKGREQVIRSNAGASLIDLGDGVACLEFHTKMNVIGGDTIAMMQAAVEEVERHFVGLVIGNEAEYFSAGANLALILLEIQNEEWDVIDQMVSTFQQANQALRQMSKPVVAAPAGMALAGGCEICLAADRIHAAAETYMGLVEVGVGLIPAGGGCLALLQRAFAGLPNGVAIDLFPLTQRLFETIGLAKVSTSAAEARQLGFLRASDAVTVYRDALLHQAKQSVLDLAMQDYTPPLPGMVRVAGRSGYGNFLAGLYNMELARQISAYDRHIGRKLAYVLTGGDTPDGSRVSEQHILDLEREAFLSLCGEVKTQERILHMLQHNKPLRN